MVARFQVDRWYRNENGASAVLQFEPYSSFAAEDGHACLDFRPGTPWIVFATEQNGKLELLNDCDGAAAISPLLGPALEGGLMAQMVADFSAGLEDPEQTGRILSLQRLGGLRSASSRPVLHRIIDRETGIEAQWAVYAALRTGDSTVLPAVRDLLVSGSSGEVTAWAPVELCRLKDASAIAGLIEIANTAPQSAARECAISALSEKIHAVESVRTMAAHLTDPDPGVRYYALNGLRILTKEPACTLPMEPRWTEDMVEPQIQKCEDWWARIGISQF